MKKTPVLQPLKMLDLAACQTVSDIVEEMRHCSFGARMLGETAAKLTAWCRQTDKPLVIFDGRLDSPLGRELRAMRRYGWFAGIRRPETYVRRPEPDRNALVVGAFSERHAAPILGRAPGTTIYVNNADLAGPGQVKDGYFPDAVFADEAFIITVLARVLLERLEGETVSVGQLVEALRPLGGVAHQVAQGADTVISMVADRQCFRFLTLSGAMTVAQLSLVICEMIERGIVQAVTSTGALMAHGLVPGLGLKHYKYDPKDDDRKLAGLGLNRVTDTLEPETNFDHIDDIMREVIDGFDGATPISPRLLHAAIGRYLAARYPQERAILKSAHERGVPVFVPAFSDSELGNDVYVSNRQRELAGRRRVIMDLELDSAELIRLMAKAERAGIMTFGGGVPRNWTQNVAPLMEISNHRLNRFGEKLPTRKFRYGCRVCPDRPHFGHLSGCTYEEGKSWRKFHQDGQFAEIRADATQVWPFLVKHVMDWQDGRH